VNEPERLRVRFFKKRNKKGAKGTGLNDLCHRSLQTRQLWFVQPLPIRTLKSALLTSWRIVSKDKLAAKHRESRMVSQNSEIIF
jgi:hypothetical protein